MSEEQVQPTPETTEKGAIVKKQRRAFVRKHKVENINRNQLAQTLDAYATEGRVVVAMNISRDIGGTYEVVSYKDEQLDTTIKS